MDQVKPKNANGLVPETSSTLLRQLASGADSDRWAEFVDLYTPVLVYWLNCLRRGPLPSLSPDMFDDIVQETMVSLMKLFPKRNYDRERARFRTLLSTILRRRVVDYLSKSGREGLQSATAEDFDRMQASGRFADPRGQGDDEDVRRLRADLWRLLIDRVFAESNFAGRSKTLFLRHISGEKLGDLADEFGIDRNAAYQLKSRIVRKLAAKARTLEKESGDIVDMICALEREKEDADNGR